MHKIIQILLINMFATISYAQENLNFQYIFKKDTDSYREIIDKNWDQSKNVTMILKADIGSAHYLWFFEKENKVDVKGGAGELSTIKYHNLKANLMLEDHTGLIQIARFQDFGNEVYTPEFQYPYCLADDADKDGKPEFYLTYLGASDGLDEKPLKVIIYSASNLNHDKYTKSKATAWYPGGNENDVYHVEYDANWNKLPIAIQERGLKILNDIRVQNVLVAGQTN